MDNFPFKTADEFLKATEKKVRKMATVNILDPKMPDTTPAERMGVGAAILGVVAYTQSEDTTIQLATIICSTLIVLSTVFSNAWIRGKRNERIGGENVTQIESAAMIAVAELDEGE